MAAGKAIAEPLKGAGQPNPACGTTERKNLGAQWPVVVESRHQWEVSQAIVLLITYRNSDARSGIRSDPEQRPRMSLPGEPRWNGGSLHDGQSRRRKRQFAGDGGWRFVRGWLLRSACRHGGTGEVYKIIEPRRGLKTTGRLDHGPAPEKPPSPPIHRQRGGYTGREVDQGFCREGWHVHHYQYRKQSPRP